MVKTEILFQKIRIYFVQRKQNSPSRQEEDSISRGCGLIADFSRCWTYAVTVDFIFSFCSATRSLFFLRTLLGDTHIPRSCISCNPCNVKITYIFSFTYYQNLFWFILQVHVVYTLIYLQLNVSLEVSTQLSSEIVSTIDTFIV